MQQQLLPQMSSNDFLFPTEQDTIMYDVDPSDDYMFDEDILMAEAEKTIEDYLDCHDDPMDIDVFDLYDDPMDVDEASTNDASSPEEVVFVEYEDVHSSDASTVLLSSEEEEDDDDDDDEEEEDDDEEEEDDDEEDSEEEEEEEDPELESRVANFFQGLQTEIGL